MNWQSFQANNSQLSTEEAYRRFREVEEIRLQEAVVSKASRLGASNAQAVTTFGGKTKHLFKFKVKAGAPGTYIGFEFIQKPIGEVIVDWGDGTFEPMQFNSAASGYPNYGDREHTYTDTTTEKIVTVKGSTASNIMEIFMSYDGEVVEISDISSMTNLLRLEIDDAVSLTSISGLPNSLVYFIAGKNSSFTKFVNIPTSLKEVNLSSNKLTISEANRLLDSLILNGVNTGELVFTSNTSLSQTSAMYNKHKYLQSNMGWAITFTMGIAQISSFRSGQFGFGLIFSSHVKYLDGVYDYSPGFTFKKNGVPMEFVHYERFEAFVEFTLQNDTFSPEDVVTFSYDSEVGIITSLTGVKLASITDQLITFDSAKPFSGGE